MRLSELRSFPPLLLAAVAAATSFACTTTESRGYTAESVLARPPAPGVALLPIELDVRIDALTEVDEADEAALKAAVVAEVQRLLKTSLPRRGYSLERALSWDDDSVDTKAIEDFVDGMVGHANEVASGGEPGGEIDPTITRYLGEATGAGSLLYLNGTLISNSDGKKALQVAVSLFAVIVIAAMIVAASEPAGRGGGHMHGGSHTTVFIGGPVFYSSHGTPPARDPMADRGFYDGDLVRVAATLVDASSGEILWYVDFQDGVDPEDPEELSEYLRELFAALPAAEGAPESADDELDEEDDGAVSGPSSPEPAPKKDYVTPPPKPPAPNPAAAPAPDAAPSAAPTVDAPPKADTSPKGEASPNSDAAPGSDAPPRPLPPPPVKVP